FDDAVYVWYKPGWNSVSPKDKKSEGAHHSKTRLATGTRFLASWLSSWSASRNIVCSSSGGRRGGEGIPVINDVVGCGISEYASAGRLVRVNDETSNGYSDFESFVDVIRLSRTFERDLNRGYFSLASLPRSRNKIEDRARYLRFDNVKYSPSTHAYCTLDVVSLLRMYILDLGLHALRKNENGTGKTTAKHPSPDRGLHFLGDRSLACPSWPNFLPTESSVLVISKICLLASSGCPIIWPVQGDFRAFGLLSDYLGLSTEASIGVFSAASVLVTIGPQSLNTFRLQPSTVLAMADPTSCAHLPPELEHDIFLLAFQNDYRDATNLVLIAKRVFD
ncbi:hypothetical protein BDN72DRAFT_866329, partial [Pluteus cervinus]